MCETFGVVVFTNLLVTASYLVATASNLVGMASYLCAMASYLLMASNLLALASNLRDACNLWNCLAKFAILSTRDGLPPTCDFLRCDDLQPSRVGSKPRAMASNLLPVLLVS